MVFSPLPVVNQHNRCYILLFVRSEIWFIWQIYYFTWGNFLFDFLLNFKPSRCRQHIKTKNAYFFFFYNIYKTKVKMWFCFRLLMRQNCNIQFTRVFLLVFIIIILLSCVTSCNKLIIEKEITVLFISDSCHS